MNINTKIFINQSQLTIHDPGQFINQSQLTIHDPGHLVHDHFGCD